MFTVNAINQISIGNELRSEANDTNVKCNVVGGLTTFSFRLYLLVDLYKKSNSSIMSMPKEITQESSPFKVR